jgi:hypothetical protein
MEEDDRHFLDEETRRQDKVWRKRVSTQRLAGIGGQKERVLFFRTWSSLRLVRETSHSVVFIDLAITSCGPPSVKTPAHSILANANG